MKFRRDLIIVALVTFCLTATVFMVVPTRSADDPNWNPWADLQDDGTVDIYDAITLANAFGSSGDTPKNVNVTNWPTQLPAPNYRIDHYNLNISWNSGYGSTGFEGYLDGYSRMSYQITVYYWWPNSSGTVSFWAPSIYVMIKPIGGGTHGGMESLNSSVLVFALGTPYQGFSLDTATMIETKAPHYTLFINCNSTISTGWMLADVFVYLRNE